MRIPAFLARARFAPADFVAVAVLDGVARRRVFYLRRLRPWMG